MFMPIAKETTFCVCGSLIDRGETITVVQGRAVHAGCEKKAAPRDNEDQQMDLWRSSFEFSETQREALRRAEEITGAPHIKFDGETVRAIDIPRLAGQIASVYGLMKDGQFRTLLEIATACGCLETSAGARLRDLRKERFGAHEVESRQISTNPLVFEYRVILNHGPAARTNEQREAA
jgi:hypothetical protein